MANINVYEIVTERILAELEKGNIPWKKPWIRPTVSVSYTTRKVEIDPTTCAYSRSTGRPYSLLNQMLLLRPGEWATYKQITEAGGQVKKGEKSSICVFWKFLDTKKTDAKGNVITDANGDPVIDKIPILRYYNVFHVETQAEGISPKKRNPHEIVTTAHVTETSAEAEWAAIEEADAIVRAYLDRSGVKLTEDPTSDRAFYRPSADSVTVPSKAQFKDPAEFYGTLFHELTHSTGHHSRLNRFSESGSHACGSENYSKEELVAELGASALVNYLGIESKASFRNNAAYIQSWIKALRDDTRLIVSASGKAEKAVNYILAGEQ